MNCVEFIYSDNRYRCKRGSSLKMELLGRFLATDAGFYSHTFIEWAWNNDENHASSNITFLRKENGKVFLSDLYSEEDKPTELEMTLNQFIQLLEDWRDKVCTPRPKDVIIRHENGEFVIDTID